MAKPGLLRRCWERSGLSVSMIVILVKRALAPTIALCLLLDRKIAAYYGFVGYITAILAINTVLPQGEYVDFMLKQIFAICLASATTLLQLFCVTKARENTSAPLPPPPPLPVGTIPPPIPYNSSASAVSGIWLLIQIFLVCSIRSARQDLTAQCINYSVVVVVTSAIAPILPNMAAAETFAKQLLVVNLTGLAASVAVIMILWPSTNRKAFQEGVVMWKARIDDCLKDRLDNIGRALHLQDSDDHLDSSLSVSASAERSKTSATDPVITLLGSVSSLEQDLMYAKREVSFSYLSGDKLAAIHAYQDRILQPVLGLICGMDLIQKLGSEAHSSFDRHTMSKWRNHTQRGCDLLNDVLSHSIRLLRFSPQFSRSPVFQDVESAGPDGKGGIQTLKSRLEDIKAEAASEVEAWRDADAKTTGSASSDTGQSLLFGFLEVTACLVAACTEAMHLAEYAEGKVSDGTMARRRLIVPSLAHLLESLHLSGSNTTRVAGSSAITKPDPMQANATFGRMLSRLGSVLRSPHAGFALRIALAAMCALILAFLSSTQRWFNVNRGVWTAITIAIVTNRTIGQSVFGIISQLAGTLTGALFSLIAWYIVDLHLAGVIVFYWIGMVILGYPAQRKPSLLSYTMVSSVTLTLLVGYELETERIGRAAIEANGQPYYPPYILSWLNLLAILAGVGIAVFWTVFPYPILESDEVKVQVAQFVDILSELYVRTHKAVYSSLKGHSGAGTADAREYTALQKTMISKLANLSQLLDNTAYQIPVGGRRFSREEYAKLLASLERIFRSLSVTYYSTQRFDETSAEHRTDAWLTELRRIATPNTANEARSVSALLACAMAIARSQPLWQIFVLDMPETASLLTAIKSSPMDLLSSRHVLEPGYTALASIHASAVAVSEELKELIALTSDLVGRLDVVELEWDDVEKKST